MSVPHGHVQVGRLAMREEGDKWNAYYAVDDTMSGAVWLGSIAMRFVATDPEASPQHGFDLGEWKACGCFLGDA